MTTLIYNPDGTIKNFVSSIEGLELQPGETTLESPLSFAEYAARFSLSHNGQTCQTVFAHVGDAPVEIEVSAPGQSTVDVDVNGQVQTVPLSNGRGILAIPTDTPGPIPLAPADRRTFCAAGDGSLLVVLSA